MMLKPWPSVTHGWFSSHNLDTGEKPGTAEREGILPPSLIYGGIGQEKEPVFTSDYGRDRIMKQENRPFAYGLRIAPESGLGREIGSQRPEVGSLKTEVGCLIPGYRGPELENGSKRSSPALPGEMPFIQPEPEIRL